MTPRPQVVTLHPPQPIPRRIGCEPGQPISPDVFGPHLPNPRVPSAPRRGPMRYTCPQVTRLRQPNAT